MAFQARRRCRRPKRIAPREREVLTLMAEGRSSKSV
jgi:DNA-binding CsgD family transcriptional regulator